MLPLHIQAMEQPYTVQIPPRPRCPTRPAASTATTIAYYFGSLFRPEHPSDDSHLSSAANPDTPRVTAVLTRRYYPTGGGEAPTRHGVSAQCRPQETEGPPQAPLFYLKTSPEAACPRTLRADTRPNVPDLTW